MPDETTLITPDAFIRGARGSVDDVSPSTSSKKWVVSRINTDAVDAYGTVIMPDGMNKRDYDKNRVVLWEHGKDPARGRMPIGRNDWIKSRKEQRDIIAKTIFSEDEFGRGLFDLYRDGFLSAWSIYGNGSKEPGECGPPTPAEIRKRPELARCSTIYRTWTLAEYSAVAVPGNADALTEEVGRSQAQLLVDAIDRGLWVPEIVHDRLAKLPPLTPTPKLPPLRGRTMEEVEAAVFRKLMKQLGPMLDQAEKDAWDIARGRV